MIKIGIFEFWRVNITADRTRQRIEDLKVPPFFVGPDPNDPNTQIFRIAAHQPFGVIYGSRWIKTPQQLQEVTAKTRCPIGGRTWRKR